MFETTVWKKHRVNNTFFKKVNSKDGKGNKKHVLRRYSGDNNTDY